MRIRHPTEVALRCVVEVTTTPPGPASPDLNKEGVSSTARYCPSEGEGVVDPEGSCQNSDNLCRIHGAFLIF